jgi:hypothetical protein
LSHPSDTSFRNKNLFSDYYLKKYLPNSPEWKCKDHIEIFSQIKKIFSRESATIKNLNEKQLENHFYNEIFSTLGFVYEVTEPTEAKNFPDYAFFFDRGDRDDAHKNKETISFFTNAVAIGEVKQWKVDLDKVSKNEYNISENPSLQIWTYLDDTNQKWGILSNGRIWRLYCKEKRRDNFIEINLSQLIESNDIDNFKFFYYFFRKEAFVKSKEGPAFLDRILNESKEYAEKIGDDLKDNVYLAMKVITEGYINQKSNKLDSRDPATLARVQNNSMILLYRFLFLLYAEGKGLLDLNDPRYREYYSFHSIKHFIAETQDGPAHQRFDHVKCAIRENLKILFKLVDEGSESFGIPKEEYFIPAYNGGLFDPNNHPDLERWEISDRYLADAIDLLSRSKLKEGHRDFIDYSTLEIRNLGSIYEGLLEYKLKIAETDLVVNDGEWVTLDEYNVNKKRKKEFADFDEIDRVNTGHFYLSTDKGKRKATGSYYTPDYIVNYIVKKTIEPVVERKWGDAKEKNERFIDATLSIKVLDPAMGSGHFLVGAVDFLSEKLIAAMLMDNEAGRIPDTTLYTNDWARREVVSHCIYGVDLNNLAVELAKVGLWLTTISRDKPLSFLDHRLKRGNSLIGAKISDLAWYHEGEGNPGSKTGQQPIVPPVFVKKILNKISEIEQISENNLDDIKKKEKIFNELQNISEYQSVMQIADLNTSFYFGNKIETATNKLPSSYYYNLVGSMYSLDTQWGTRSNYSWFKKALEIGNEKMFFHWELEFPEIFFDAGKLREDSGWDAVIGNPPWGADFDDFSKKYITINYKSSSGELESHIFFSEKGISLINSNGLLGFITPNTWLSQKRGENLRKYLLGNCKIIELVHLTKNIFKDVPDIVPVIFTLSTGNNSEPVTVKILKNGLKNISLIDDNFELINFIDVKKWNDGKECTFNIYLTDIVELLLKKIEQNSDEISKNFEVHYGIKTGDNEKNLAKSKIRDNFVPCLERAAEIKRYEIKWFGQYLDYGRHLNGYKNHNVAVPKILIQYTRKLSMKRRIVAGFDSEGKFYPLNRFSYIFSKTNNYNLYFLMALLSSKTLNYYHANKFNDYDIKPTYLQKHPIHRISFTTPANHRSSYLKELMEMYSSFIQNDDPQPILSCIDIRIDAKPEESDVIHDFLAFLAEQVVNLNKVKNIEIKAFLSFIETEISASIDSLDNKTLLQEYYSNEFPQIVEVLVKNKNKIKAGYNPKNRANHDNLKDWYDSSIVKLKPLKVKIEATDTLIDQIVYKLYGLTKEEIQIIEAIEL